MLCISLRIDIKANSVSARSSNLVYTSKERWKFLFTAKDTWLGPDLHLGIPAIYNLKQDPAEHYDMTFNGAAPATAGVLKSSPGRYSGADNGWAGVFSMIPLTDFVEPIKKYPNIPTTPAGSSMGAGLPEFIPPNLASQK
jgi:hypothetical protein